MIDQSMKRRVMDVFNQLQSHEPYVPIISEIERFAKELHADWSHFAECFQQGYLKICKNLKVTGSQTPQVFVNVVSTLAQYIQKVNTSKISQIKFQESIILKFNQFQLKLFSKLSMSKVLSIRIFGAKLLFILLKEINPPLSHISYQVPILQEVLKSILLLISEKNKILKRHGLKLSSLLQQVQISNLCKQLDYLKNQVLGIIKTNQDEETRQIAFKNLILNNKSLDQFILRLRDKNPKIRETVYNKLVQKKMCIWDIGLNNVYKILYDGMSSLNKDQKQQCVNYFYNSFGKQPNQNTSSNILRSQPYSSFVNFLNFMKPSILMQHPVLLEYFEQVVKFIFNQKPTSANLSKYLRYLCEKMLNSKQCTDQIFYVRILAQSPSCNYFKPLQQKILSFGHISQLLWTSYINNKYFQVLQLFKLAQANINSDQIGKQKLTEVIYKILSQPIHHQVEIGKLDNPTDVCVSKTNQQIKNNRLLLSQYQTHPIHSTIDLIPIMIKCLLNMNQRTKVEIQLKQIIDNLDRLKVSFKKQTEVAKVSLNKLKQKESGQVDLISDFEKNVEQLLQKQQIVKLRFAWLTYYLYTYTKQTSFEVFTTAYDIIYSSDLPMALLILGSFALNNSERLTKHYQQLMQHCVDAKQQSIQKLVCIRCLTDLSIKYRPARLKTSQQIHFQTFVSTTLSNSLFSTDKQLRITAIESFCRLLYNQIIPQPMLYFVYLMILWFDTNSPTKSIHLISVFIKNYIQKQESNSIDISEYLQILILTLNKLQLGKKTINSEYINYPMKHEAFIKKLISIAMNILKHKSKSKDFKDSTFNPRVFGPRQSFVLFILQNKQLCKYADTILENTNLISSSTPEQLNLIKSSLSLNREISSKIVVKTFLEDVCRYLSTQRSSGQIECTLRSVFQSQQSKIKLSSQEVIHSLCDMNLIQKLDQIETFKQQKIVKVNRQVLQIMSSDSDERNIRLNQ